MSIELATDEAPTRPPTRTPIVDCDIHELLLTPAELAPYLKKPWSDWVSHWPGLYDVPHVHPLGGASGRRAIVAAATGAGKKGVPGVDYELMAAEHLDAFGIEYGVLTSLFYPAVMRTQPEFASAVASAYNDWLIDQWLARDDRLLASIQIAPQEPAAAIREIERVADHPQMVQVMLPIVDVAYGDPRFHGIFEAAQRHGLLIAMHQTGSTNGPFGLGRYQIEWHCALPLAFQAEVMSLIFNGVLDRFPGLKVVMLEGGFTWVPQLMWRMDQQYKFLHVEVPWVKRMPSDVIREHFRFATQPMEDISGKELTTLFELAGSDDWVVFSSDYPHWDHDEANRALPSGLSPATRDKIMFQSARDLYGLPGRLRARA